MREAAKHKRHEHGRADKPNYIAIFPAHLLRFLDPPEGRSSALGWPTTKYKYLEAASVFKSIKGQESIGEDQLERVLGNRRWYTHAHVCAKLVSPKRMHGARVDRSQMESSCINGVTSGIHMSAQGTKMLDLVGLSTVGGTTTFRTRHKPTGEVPYMAVLTFHKKQKTAWAALTPTYVVGMNTLLI